MEKHFFLYVAALDEAVGIMLITKRNDKQRSIYYIGEVLHGAEVWYQKIKKLSYAIVLALRRLKHYFRAHSIIVQTNQPIRQILKKPNLARQLVSW